MAARGLHGVDCPAEVANARPAAALVPTRPPHEPLPTNAPTNPAPGRRRARPAPQKNGSAGASVPSPGIDDSPLTKADHSPASPPWKASPPQARSKAKGANVVRQPKATGTRERASRSARGEADSPG